MTASEILWWLIRHGVSVHLGKDGNLVAKRVGYGLSDERFREIVERVKAQRDVLLRYLRGIYEPEIECEWETGNIGAHSFPEEGWPVGARRWRKIGTSEWTEIPEPERADAAKRAKDAVARWKTERD